MYICFCFRFCPSIPHDFVTKWIFIHMFYIFMYAINTVIVKIEKSAYHLIIVCLGAELLYVQSRHLHTHTHPYINACALEQDHLFGENFYFGLMLFLGDYFSNTQISLRLTWLLSPIEMPSSVGELLPCWKICYKYGCCFCSCWSTK